jgi:hypothetical protein
MSSGLRASRERTLFGTRVDKEAGEIHQAVCFDEDVEQIQHPEVFDDSVLNY